MIELRMVFRPPSSTTSDHFSLMTDCGGGDEGQVIPEAIATSEPHSNPLAEIE